MKKFNKTHAFTMAEILISLTIIGVIAAITLPALRANINESTWNTQRKALYSRMSQAISMMPALNGYGIGSTDAETNSKATMAFVSEGLDKVLKINNICDSTELTKCGIPNKITTMANAKMDFPKNLTELNPMFTSTYVIGNNSFTNPQKNINTNAVAFETTNGESVAVFYNPICVDKNIIFNVRGYEAVGEHYSQPYMCANFIYDLNGTKGPNTVGKDIGFITLLYSIDSNCVAPMPLAVDAAAGGKMTQSYATTACNRQDKNSRVPNIDELNAILYNAKLINALTSNGNYWSSTLYSNPNYAMDITSHSLARQHYIKSGSFRVRCIKR